ncbi:hypothetical protein VTO42DRAFT_2438 [Malbranchea cinnamomea]
MSFFGRLAGNAWVILSSQVNAQSAAFFGSSNPRVFFFRRSRVLGEPATHVHSLNHQQITLDAGPSTRRIKGSLTTRIRSLCPQRISGFVEEFCDESCPGEANARISKQISTQ